MYVQLLMLAAVFAATIVLAGRYLDTTAPAGGIVGRLRFVFRNLASDVGALTLVESAKLSQNDLQRGVIETFVMESVLLDRLPLMPIEGNAYAYNEESALPGIEFRAVNSAYTESTGTFNQKTETLVILGGDADVDTFLQKTRGNLNDQRAEQTRMKVKANVYKFQDAFFNGDVAVDANSFDGLKKRLTGAQVIDAATNGLPIIGANEADRHAFLDQIDALIGSVTGAIDALYMNRAIRAKVLASMRRLGPITFMERLSFGDDDANGALVNIPGASGPGQEVRVPVYNGIPLLDPGKKADGTDIIPLTETQGTAVGTASSIYAVRFGNDESDGAVTGLTNGGVDVRDLGEIDVKPVFRTRIEFFCGLAVFGKGAARLRGVLNG
jgi:hypothetical protein